MSIPHHLRTCLSPYPSIHHPLPIHPSPTHPSSPTSSDRSPISTQLSFDPPPCLSFPPRIASCAVLSPSQLSEFLFTSSPPRPSIRRGAYAPRIYSPSSRSYRFSAREDDLGGRRNKAQGPPKSAVPPALRAVTAAEAPYYGGISGISHATCALLPVHYAHTTHTLLAVQRIQQVPRSTRRPPYIVRVPLYLPLHLVRTIESCTFSRLRLPLPPLSLWSFPFSLY